MSTTTNHRDEAARHAADAAASFERCDIDGFVSQWASGKMSDLERRKAELAEAGGLAPRLALFDLDGNPVAAKLIDGKFGPCWALLEDFEWDARFTGEFVSHRKRQSTFERKGFRVGLVNAPCVAELGGGGTGLAGAVNVSVVTRQIGFGDDVISDGRNVGNVGDLFA